MSNGSFNSVQTLFVVCKLYPDFCGLQIKFCVMNVHTIAGCLFLAGSWLSDMPHGLWISCVAILASKPTGSPPELPWTSMLQYYSAFTLLQIQQSATIIIIKTMSIINVYTLARKLTAQIKNWLELNWTVTAQHVSLFLLIKSRCKFKSQDCKDAFTLLNRSKIDAFGLV